MCNKWDIDPARVLYKKPHSGQDGLIQQQEWLEDPDVIIQLGDSLKALVNEKSIIKDIEKGIDGRANQKLVNDFLEKVLARVAILNKTIIFIDHLKKRDIGVPGRYKWDTASGVSIKFYSSARWFLKSMSKITKTTDGDKETLGCIAKLSVDKTTVSPMLEIDNIIIKFREGISSFKWYAQKALAMKIITMKKEGKKKIFTFKDDIIAETDKAFKLWSIKEGKKIWKAICKAIDKKEHEKFEKRINEIPPTFKEEFEIK